MTNEKKPTGWLAIRRRLNAQSKPALLALVKDFYGVSSNNRDFLHARVQAEAGDGTTVERYRRTIIEQFYPSEGSESSNWLRRAKPSAITAGPRVTWQTRLN
jgi:hypothetical protein